MLVVMRAVVVLQEQWLKTGSFSVASLWTLFQIKHLPFLLTRQGVYVLRFKTFNTMFEELHQKQSQWTVPDAELRESLILAVAEVLLPAYRSFVKRFGCVFSF